VTKVPLRGCMYLEYDAENVFLLRLQHSTYIRGCGDDGDELNVILSLALRSHYCLFAERALFMCMHIYTLLQQQLPPLVTRKVS
jgi:hypothetical protein